MNARTRAHRQTQLLLSILIWLIWFKHSFIHSFLYNLHHRLRMFNLILLFFFNLSMAYECACEGNVSHLDLMIDWFQMIFFSSFISFRISFSRSHKFQSIFTYLIISDLFSWSLFLEFVCRDIFFNRQLPTSRNFVFVVVFFCNLFFVKCLPQS